MSDRKDVKEFLDFINDTKTTIILTDRLMNQNLHKLVRVRVPDARTSSGRTFSVRRRAPTPTHTAQPTAVNNKRTRFLSTNNRLNTISTGWKIFLSLAGHQKDEAYYKSLKLKKNTEKCTSIRAVRSHYLSKNKNNHRNRTSFSRVTRVFPVRQVFEQ